MSSRRSSGSPTRSMATTGRLLDPATLVLLRHGQSTWNLVNLFTGWHDVPLSERGVEEAREAGRQLTRAGLQPDIVHTSVLIRAIQTADIALGEMGRTWIPVRRSWRLNERHYGALQGLNKKETSERYGADQVKLWRRSYDTPPPNGEALKNTAERTLPFFDRAILGDLQLGKNVLVVAHGNSNRSIVMKLDQLSKEQVIELELGTGVPLVYDIGQQGEVL